MIFSKIKPPPLFLKAVLINVDKRILLDMQIGNISVPVCSHLTVGRGGLDPVCLIEMLTS